MCPLKGTLSGLYDPLLSARNSLPFYLCLLNSYSSFRYSIFYEAFLHYQGKIQTPSVLPQHPWVFLLPCLLWCIEIIYLGVERAYNPGSITFWFTPIMSFCVAPTNWDMEKDGNVNYHVVTASSASILSRKWQVPTPRDWNFRSQVSLWVWDHVTPTLPASWESLGLGDKRISPSLHLEGQAWRTMGLRGRSHKLEWSSPSIWHSVL